jgi:single-strand DNA-binding protein
MQKIIISGNLGKDAEIQKLESGRNCVRFNVAVNSIKGKGDAKHTQTQWYGVSYFINSEAILQYLRKGSKVVVCGNLDLDVFKSEKTGQMFVNANILASDVEIVGFVENDGDNQTAKNPNGSGAGLPPMPTDEPDFL